MYKKQLLLYKCSTGKLFVIFFAIMLILSGCRSVDGNVAEEGTEDSYKIKVNTEIKEQYHVYAIKENSGQTLQGILKGLKKEKKEGKMDEENTIWTYNNDKTGEYIVALMKKNRDQVYSFAYKASKKEYIDIAMNDTMNLVWKPTSDDSFSETEKSLDFLPIETAIQETQSFLNKIGFPDVGMYRYAAVDGDTAEEGYYYMIFTPQTDGILHFTSEGEDYYRPDLVNKSALAPALTCIYDKDGIYCVMVQSEFFTVQSDLGAVNIIPYEEALEKARVSMDYMESVSELQKQDKYQWNSANVEYLPYHVLEQDAYQLLPVWVFHGQKEQKDTISEAYILLDARTGEVLSESR